MYIVLFVFVFHVWCKPFGHVVGSMESILLFCWSTLSARVVGYCTSVLDGVIFRLAVMVLLYTMDSTRVGSRIHLFGFVLLVAVEDEG